MKNQFMRIRAYCRETGFPEQTMRNLTRSYMAHKFSHRTSDKPNAHTIINVPKFEKMWDAGEFRNVL